MRIVHAVRSDGFAGVERYVAELARAQALGGHELAVIGGDPGQMRSSWAGVAIRHRAARTVADVVAGINAFRRADVLHVHMTAAEAAGVLAVGARCVPMVATRHFAERRGQSPLGRLSAPLIGRRLAGQLAISEYVARSIEGPSVVVHSGVAVVDAPPVPRGRTLLMAQRLEVEKGGAVALQAFARSGLAGQGWVFQVAGDGSQRAPLEGLVRSLGVQEQVQFLGSRQDVGDLLRRAGMLIAPCPVEGLGLTALEAMAAATPVVAAGAGGHLETVGLVDGAALFAPGDATDAARHLGRLAADPAGRDAYGARLRAVQRERFTIDRQVAAVEDFYRSIV